MVGQHVSTYRENPVVDAICWSRLITMASDPEEGFRRQLFGALSVANKAVKEAGHGSDVLGQDLLVPLHA
jgi:hypothetical protein